MAKTTGRQTKGSMPIMDSTRIIGVEAGKLPPQAVDVEEAVLGAVMLEKDAIYDVIEILNKPDCFYKESHSKIYQAIISLYSREEPIDQLTVMEELRRKGTLDEIGGPFYITQLTMRVLSSVHAEYHARIIYQKYIQRELIRVSTNIQERSFDESMDVEDLLNNAEQAIFEITQGSLGKDIQKIDFLLKEARDSIHEAESRDSLSGTPSGYTELDRLTAGWQPTDLIIVAARPSMGKTAFALSMARNMAVDHGCAVAFFSLEMSAHQLVRRMLVSETELNAEAIRSGKLSTDEWMQLDTKIRKLVEAPIFIDDTPALSVFEFRAKCRRLVHQHNIRMAMVDYLQLMTWTGDTKFNREQEVSNISRSLKAIAKELNIPVIALAQLNREVEKRTGGIKKQRPQLSDLRDSGGIEQDADIVALIHRPEYYGFTEDPEDGLTSLRGVAEILIAKHRNGKTADIRLTFKHQFAKFVEPEDLSVSFDGSQIVQSRMNKDDVTPIDAEYGKSSFPTGEKTNEDQAPF